MRRLIAKWPLVGSWYVDEYGEFVKIIAGFNHSYRYTSHAGRCARTYTRSYDVFIDSNYEKRFNSNNKYVAGIEKLYELNVDDLKQKLPKPKYTKLVKRTFPTPSLYWWGTGINPIKPNTHYLACEHVTDGFYDHKPLTEFGLVYVSDTVEYDRRIETDRGSWKRIDNAFFRYDNETGKYLMLFDLNAADRKKYWPEIILCEKANK